MSKNEHESFAWKIGRTFVSVQAHRAMTKVLPIMQQKHTQGEAEERTEPPLRLGVLISGSGSNLQALIDAIENKQLSGIEIALVVSNNAHAYGVQRALKHNVPVIYLPWRRQNV